MSISRIKYKYLQLRWMETILFGLAVGAIMEGVCFVFNLSFFVAIVAMVLTILWRGYSLGLSRVDDLKIALYLNRFYPELKESGDLFIKDQNDLTSLEQIQLGRIEIPKVKLPHKLPLATLSFVLSIGVAALVIWISSIGLLFQNAISESKFNPNQTTVPIDPSIRSILVTITPPAYTRLPKTETLNLSFSAVEGSIITWKFSFDEQLPPIKLTITGGDSLFATPLTTHNSQLTTIVTTSLIYRIQNSDYYKIDVKPDNVPRVSIKDIPQFTRLKWGEKNSIEVTSNISDDYGLTQSHVIATVSKGSGESVKFREEKLPFISPSKITGTNIAGKLTLDFQKLGMDPGDEVYFYVEAYDNKQGQPQRNRTNTYFISLQDTTQQEMSMDEGLGVDLMPDYFRSQRQLIIDTEKLLADQKAKKVTKKQFNSTSNELGYDQKVLRLRYGQFLGEEFETSIGESDVEHEQHEEDEEAENDKDEKKSGDEVLKKFGHEHDTEETATFFNLSIKAKLRAALTLMWDSELKLRMFTPKESLPTQYQILKLLKEISQDSRIYVHRMGFDPPPIKEEKRLTGSLDEIKPAAIETKRLNNSEYPAIRLALTDVSGLLLGDNITLDDQQRTDLHSAGDELAALALKSPGNYLQALSDLKSIAENKMDSTVVRAKLEEIQKVFWTVLPNEAPSPTQRGSSAHPLDLKLLEEIKAKAND